MEPVAISLDRLQGEKNCGQGFIIPTLMSMRHRILFVNENGNTLLKFFQEAMLKVIDRRFSKYFEINQPNRDLVVAMLSMPRFKSTFIKEDTDFEIARNLFLTECLKLASKENADRNQENQVNPEAVDDFFLTFSARPVHRRNSIEQNIEAEINKYLEDDRKEIQILNEYPSIKEAYFKFNTTLSASAVVERVFSQSALIFTPHRNRISEENFERVVLLKYNLKLID